VKPSRVEAGQVWTLEEVGVEKHPLRAPLFVGTYLVLRLTVLESARRRHFLGEPWTTQAFGLVLDAGHPDVLVLDDPPEPDGLVCIDYLDNLLHSGPRLHADSSHRWRHVG
jgi:hypothetical protein